jgi:hypothetical protein
MNTFLSLMKTQVPFFYVIYMACILQMLLSESELLYDWRFTANQYVLATSPLRLKTTNFIFQLNTWGCSPYLTPSLTRGWICCLQLLLVLASVIILRSVSRGIHDHILLYPTPPPHRMLLFDFLFHSADLTENTQLYYEIHSVHVPVRAQMRFKSIFPNFLSFNHTSKF